MGTQIYVRAGGHGSVDGSAGSAGNSGSSGTGSGAAVDTRVSCSHGVWRVVIIIMQELRIAAKV